jgi:hypothetical protein
MLITFLPFRVVTPVVAVPALDDAAPVNDPFDVQVFRVVPVLVILVASAASNQNRQLGIMVGVNEVAVVRLHLVER